jgi:3-hydroxybutyryl-CoA dehydratase
VPYNGRVHAQSSERKGDWMIAGYYEDVHIGQTFASGGRTITEALDLQFAMLSGDWHPIHTDAEYAKEGRFGERIAHGMLILAVVSGLITPPSRAIEAFYGMDRARFLRPVLFGDTIHVRCTVVEKAPLKGQSGVVAVDVSALNQREEPVLGMTMKLLIASLGSIETDV